MNGTNEQLPGTWSKIKGWIVGITAILVVIPALINAGLDVYNSGMNIPKTQKERTNSDMFKKYFNKHALATVPVPIKTAQGTVDMRLSIYDAGDIFVEYGNDSQWFPFPLQQRMAVVQFISSAYAGQPSPPPKGTGQYTQSDKLVGNTIERTRSYGDGTKEVYTININTGEILNQKKTQGAPLKAMDVQVYKFPTIDLEALKKK
ncbi:MAG: hypothetical protein Q8K00_15060 [Syntrophales bacterium]|nr:hypothetical protein [Syntrophales bacterium]